MTKRKPNAAKERKPHAAAPDNPTTSIDPGAHSSFDVSESDPLDVKVAAAVARLIEIAGAAANAERIREHRNKIEQRLRSLADPHDPDHPQVARKAGRAATKDAARTMINAAAQLLDALAGSQATRALIAIQRIALPAPPREVPLALDRGAAAAAADLAPYASAIAIRHLLDMMVQLTTVRERAEQKNKPGAPDVMASDAIVLQLATCWILATGRQPGASAHRGRDTGKFAQWAFEALRALCPDSPLLGPGPHAANWTPIKNAILRLRKPPHFLPPRDELREKTTPVGRGDLTTATESSPVDNGRSCP